MNAFIEKENIKLGLKRKCWESQQTSWSWLVGEVLSDEAEEYARLKFARWQWSHMTFSSEELLKQET